MGEDRSSAQHVQAVWQNLHWLEFRASAGEILADIPRQQRAIQTRDDLAELLMTRVQHPHKRVRDSPLIHHTFCVNTH